jgi:hypothetical protein
MLAKTTTAAARHEADETAQSGKSEIWLPFLNAFRTMCLAPEPAFQRVLEQVGEMRVAA